MAQQFDEDSWPELTKFREACLRDDYNEMQQIASRNHHWYENENPAGSPMDELARTYQAQWYALKGDLDSLRKVAESHPWTINQPWTAQGWLPVSQAVSTHGDRRLVEYLIEKGADPALSVGSPDDRATVVEMARFGGHHELAEWLEQLVSNQDT